MRPDSQVQIVRWLVETGLNDCAISRATGIPRGTVRDWRHQGHIRPQAQQVYRIACPICSDAALDGWWYGYLLGLYLGDGTISRARRGVFVLRIALDKRYPVIIDESIAAIRAVRPHRWRVSTVNRTGCVEVCASWKHWPCLFPQHGPGLKHLRKIELAGWQLQIISKHPDRLLRGLIHSDGCRFMNHVNGKDYPRYMFTNHSADIRGIFCLACDVYGISWRQSNWRTISVARRRDVATLDLVIGPKRSPTTVDPRPSRAKIDSLHCRQAGVMEWET